MYQTTNYTLFQLLVSSSLSPSALTVFSDRTCCSHPHDHSRWHFPSTWKLATVFSAFLCYILSINKICFNHLKTLKWISWLMVEVVFPTRVYYTDTLLELSMTHNLENQAPQTYSPPSLFSKDVNLRLALIIKLLLIGVVAVNWAIKKMRRLSCLLNHQPSSFMHVFIKFC